MSEFEKIFNRYTVACIVAIIAFAVCAAAITVYVRGQGNFFTTP